MTTNTTEDHRRAGEAQTSGEAGNFCLFSYCCSGRPAAAIAAVTVCPHREEGGEPEYVICPLFISITDDMVGRFQAPVVLHSVIASENRVCSLPPWGRIDREAGWPDPGTLRCSRRTHHRTPPYLHRLHPKPLRPSGPAAAITVRQSSRGANPASTRQSNSRSSLCAISATVSKSVII